MSLDHLRDSLQRRLEKAPPLGYVVDLDFGDEGHVYLDGSNNPNVILDHITVEPDTTLSLTPETMRKILDGDTDPNMAVLMGKLKISGKMGVALKLASYLEQ